MPVLTLAIDRSYSAGVSKGGLATTYASGAVYSIGSAFMVAVAATLVERPAYFLLTWVVAIAYLTFDVVFSPKSDDLKRVRAVLAS